MVELAAVPESCARERFERGSLIPGFIVRSRKDGSREACENLDEVSEFNWMYLPCGELLSFKVYHVTLKKRQALHKLRYSREQHGMRLRTKTSEL